MGTEWKRNASLGDQGAGSLATMYSAKPLRIYRKEINACISKIDKKESIQTEVQCCTLAKDARKRVRSNNILPSTSFYNSKQYLQHKHELYDQNTFSHIRSADLENCRPTVKWSNPNFSQNGGTSASAVIARTKYNSLLSEKNKNFGKKE
jgi:hypothetical protein